MKAPVVLALVSLAVIAGPIVLAASSTPRAVDIHDQLRAAGEPYAFQTFQWEARELYNRTRGLFQRSADDNETVLRRQIQTVLSEKDLTVFPPLLFKLEEPPHLMVVSPRDRIAYFDRKLLRNDLTISDMESMESDIEKLGFSGLVERLGGFGATYPTIVGKDTDRAFAIDTILEEWLHQYLAFRPLGFMYVLDSLGIRSDPEAVTLNETLAGMVSEELGDEVYARYYGPKPEKKTVPGFSFSKEMRLTRQEADRLLSEGKIEEAERYMEQRRQEFVAHGYRIRKLNQAYFAFHGIYGASPASVSPIHQDLKQLRARIPSLKDFLNTVAGMTSPVDVQRALLQ